MTEKETRLYGQFSNAELTSKNAEHFYTQDDIDFLVDTLSEAAYEAIELAAEEAARAAYLENLEREAQAVREAQRLIIENDLQKQVLSTAKRTGIKNAVITGIICFLSGFLLGMSCGK